MEFEEQALGLQSDFRESQCIRDGEQLTGWHADEVARLFDWAHTCVVRALEIENFLLTGEDF